MLHVGREGCVCEESYCLLSVLALDTDCDVEECGERIPSLPRLQTMRLCFVSVKGSQGEVVTLDFANSSRTQFFLSLAIGLSKERCVVRIYTWLFSSDLLDV